MDQFFFDASDELLEVLGREATYEEVMEYMEAKDAGMVEWFLTKNKTKEIT